MEISLWGTIVDWRLRRNITVLKRIARLAQSVERKALNLVVVGSSPTVGDFLFYKLAISFLTFFLPVQAFLLISFKTFLPVPVQAFLLF